MVRRLYRRTSERQDARRGSQRRQTPNRGHIGCLKRFDSIIIGTGDGWRRGLPQWGKPSTVDYFLEAGGLALADPGEASTPKSQTKRFMPSGRISARAYSPGGSGSPRVKRYTVGAISQRCKDMVLRSSATCSPK